MGTRADFYVGRGKDAEWLGSIAWDGYPDGIDSDVLYPKTEDEFRAAVLRFFTPRDDVSGPDHGWPWPWDNSQTTDYSYAWDDGEVWVTCFGYGWSRIDDYDPDDESTPPKVEFPDMSQKKNVAMDDRSGLIIFRG